MQWRDLSHDHPSPQVETDLLPNLDEQIAEVKREIEMRRRDYARGVINRRLAAERVDVMRAVLVTLEKARGGVNE